MDDKVRAKMLLAKDAATYQYQEGGCGDVKHLVMAVFAMDNEQRLVDRRPAPKPKPLTYDEAVTNLASAIADMEGVTSGYAWTDGEIAQDLVSMADKVIAWPLSKEQEDDEQVTREQRS